MNGLILYGIRLLVEQFWEHSLASGVWNPSTDLHYYHYIAFFFSLTRVMINMQRPHEEQTLSQEIQKLILKENDGKLRIN